MAASTYKKLWNRCREAAIFAAAATCIKDKSLEEIEEWLESLLDQGEGNNESYTA